MNNLKLFFCSGLIATTFFLSAPLAQAKDDWLPVTPEDLALKDDPAHPGAKAMILYRSIQRDDQMGSQHEYVRIKIFNEEGKSYGDVNIPPFDREFKIAGVQGRTIHPDGSIVPFSGQIFEKVIVKGRNNSIKTKSFTMPEVTPGSIVEYKYTRYWEAVNPASGIYYYFPRSEWEIQSELPQRAAHFEFHPAREDMFSYRMQGLHLPEGVKFNNDSLRRIVSLDVKDIAPFEEEPFMPPPYEAEMRVLFFYSTDLRIPEGDEYWKSYGKKWYGNAEEFMNKKGAVGNAVNGNTSPSDTPEVKLQKLYTFVQGFQNLTFQSAKSEKEIKALNIREIKSVEDVLNNKYGFRNDLNRTFVALARGAGIDATVVRVTERDEALLHKEWPAFSQLDWEIAMAKVGDKTLYLDPGSPFCPFGVLPWADTGITGLVGGKNMPNWIQIPVPEPSYATIKRSANLSLTNEGSLTGEVTVTFSGEDAFRHRFRARDEDEMARKKEMEDLMKEWLPLKGDVDLLEVNDWHSANLPLVAKYKVTLPGYANQAGHRVMIPTTLFAGAYRNPFAPTKRVLPIFIEYEYDRADDVTITLPKAFQIESLPKAMSNKNGVAELSANYENENGTLHFTRDFQWKAIALETKYYGALRQYFQQVQAGTNEQAVLKMAE